MTKKLEELTENNKIVMDMLLPLILIDQNDKYEYVSIGKLSQFIDFYNFAPILISSIRHKNDTSGDLSLFMGRNVHAHSVTVKYLNKKLKDP